MDSLFNNHSFDVDEYFPAEANFKDIAEAYIDVKLNGENCAFQHNAAVIAAINKRNTKNLIKMLIASIILHWDELTKALQEASTQTILIEDIKKIIRIFIDELNLDDSYNNMIDKYTQVIKKALDDESSSTLAQTQTTQLDDTGLFTLSVYGAGGERRHVRVGKKINGVYNVCIDSAAISSYDNLFLFKSRQACTNFIKNIIAGYAQTSRPVSSYKYTIKDKLNPRMEQDLSKYIEVNTTCGPAYICKNSQYCED